MNAITKIQHDATAGDAALRALYHDWLAAWERHDAAWRAFCRHKGDNKQLDAECERLMLARFEVEDAIEAAPPATTLEGVAFKFIAGAARLVEEYDSQVAWAFGGAIAEAARLTGVQLPRIMAENPELQEAASLI